MFTVNLSKREKRSAASIQACADIVEQHRDVTGMGSSEWYRGLGTAKGARVVDASGKTVAWVSYNGRIWSPEEA